MSENDNNVGKIDEDIVRFFIWAVWNFFQKQSPIEPTVDPPYLFDRFKHDEYTGIIGVSGSQKGAVYFTMGKDMLDHIINTNYGKNIDPNTTEEDREHLRTDFAGEMANTVSGNVRNYLGEDFLISVPVVVKAGKTPLILPNKVTGIVFPIEWDGHRSHLVVALENSQLPDNDEFIMS
ncbi:chemotaxis protein CheX [Persicirhabdus sediminis]|uniref:Chemotaxis protein CheX n=1 Tax=Persicirhabdus sediminis TaxID=454144 RepID=A0A8J7MC06_9BACT|nr:chemotaxis protein CheX [Persicirhabdus sediminis]MBK1789808.1 chemotaxis protein CheX [Persicirhabdus sediminis]